MRIQKEYRIQETENIRKGDAMPYGMELILDLHDCDVVRFTEEYIEQFCIDLCKLMKMKRDKFVFSQSEPDEPNNPKTFGITASQFIYTSAIILHALPLLNEGTVYLNIFSCKDFSVDVATEFCLKFFGGVVAGKHFIERI